MLSSIATSPGFSSGLATATPTAEATSGQPADDAAADAATDSPAYQISLSAEAEFSLSITQTTKISITETSAGGASSAPQDPTAARALSTLEAVVEAQREWIAKLKAEAQGKDPSKADTAHDAKTPAKASGAQGGDETTSLQVSIEQDTEIDMSFSASAQLDVQA